MDLTLTFLRSKQNQAQRAQRADTVILGLPPRNSAPPNDAGEPR